MSAPWGGGVEKSAEDAEVVWSLQSYQERAVLGGGEVMRNSRKSKKKT